jgi:hypothetical protein
MLDKLCASGRTPPWKCKLQLRHGRTVFAVEINADGEITKVGGRAIYSTSDISFGPGAIGDVIVNPE